MVIVISFQWIYIYIYIKRERERDRERERESYMVEVIVHNFILFFIFYNSIVTMEDGDLNTG